MTTNWCINNAFVAPSRASTHIQREVQHAQFLRPFRNTLRFATSGQIAITTFIIGLLNVGSPFAILKRVITVVVDSFNRMFFCGRFAHILIEVFKGQPFGANRDTASTIAFIINGGFLSATRNHFRPNIINTRFRFSVGSASCARILFIQATATIRIFAQTVAIDFRDIATITFTPPKWFVECVASCKPQYQQATKTLVVQIAKARVRWNGNYCYVFFGSIFTVGHRIKDYSFMMLTRLADLLTQDCEPFFNYNIEAAK